MNLFNLCLALVWMPYFLLWAAFWEEKKKELPVLFIFSSVWCNLCW